MTITEVRNLPLREKFQILEAIWDDLSARMDEMSVSPAVRDLLDERVERIRTGSAEVQDWDSVKFSIGQS
ncbi:MAG: addiction module protein [Kiritimatiellia bacterium]